MTNEIEKAFLNVNRSSGLDVAMPAKQQLDLLVERMAMRLHRDKWEMPDDQLAHDWELTPAKTKEEYRGHARSALNFTREQIQAELKKNNASLDIVKHEKPVLKFRVSGPDMADYQKRALVVLADDYMGRRRPFHREFTLQITAHFRYDEYGKIQPVGFHVREIDDAGRT